MGLAPPSLGSAPTGSPAPAPNRPPGVPASARSPVAPAVASKPSAAVATPAAPAASAPKVPVAAPAPAKIEYDEDDSSDDGPTLASDAFAELQAAAQKYPLSDGPPRPAAGSPASSASNASAKAAPDVDAPEGENEAATVTVPKDVLDRVRANPKAVLEESKPKAPPPAAGRPYDDADDAAEPTKAVPREELLRGAVNDGHVVIGADAGGEDATLAVAPGEAVGMNLNAAIGETLKSAGSPLGDEGGGFPPPPHPFQGTQQMPQGMGPMPGHPGGMQPQHQDWSQAPAPPGMGMPPSQQGQQGHWSSGHMPAAIPRTPGGVQSYPGGPMMQQPQQQGAFPRGQAPTNWNPLQAPQPKSKISGQMILLIVVGFVCLAIFVTGIVLFATTKF